MSKHGQFSDGAPPLAMPNVMSPCVDSIILTVMQQAKKYWKGGGMSQGGRRWVKVKVCLRSADKQQQQLHQPPSHPAEGNNLLDAVIPRPRDSLFSSRLGFLLAVYSRSRVPVANARCSEGLFLGRAVVSGAAVRKGEVAAVNARPRGRRQGQGQLCYVAPRLSHPHP